MRPGLDDYMGRLFEDVCRAWVARTTRLPFRPTRVGAWWDATSSHEIDVVALGADHEVLVAECTWGTVDDGDLRTLRERAALLEHELPVAAQGRPRHLACFSASGHWGPAVARAIAAGTVLGFTAEDVLRP